MHGVPEPAHPNTQLPLRTKLSYGMGDIPIAVRHAAVTNFLLFFYTNVVMLSPSLAGMALALGRIWDGVNDPLVGYLSDHTTPRFGRRRFYLLISTLPLGLSFFLLWSPPQGLGSSGGYVLPTAIAADVIDYDELRTGQRREGAFFGLWTLTMKLIAALAIAPVGVTLDVIGYVPNQPQSTAPLWGLVMRYGPVPAFFLFLPFLVFLRFRFLARVTRRFSAFTGTTTIKNRRRVERQYRARPPSSSYGESRLSAEVGCTDRIDLVAVLAWEKFLGGSTHGANSQIAIRKWLAGLAARRRCMCRKHECGEGG